MRTDVISQDDWDWLEQRLGLPGRQMDVVRAIVTGHSKQRDIARALGIRVSSVKKHAERAFKNLGVHSKLELVVLVFTQLLTKRSRPNAGDD